MDITPHLNLPSPLTLVKTTWTEAAQIELWIKRDDLIHPIISGNKWRKLSGFLDRYSPLEYISITTYGGAYSNHLVATAAACAILNRPCTGIIRGEQPAVYSPVLKLCQYYGMQLEFVSREQYTLSNRTEGIQNNILYIPEGGAHTLGTVGCAQILAEVNLMNIDTIFVACGTGATVSGMAHYLKKHRNIQKLCGIQVLKGEGYIQAEIQRDYDISDVKIYDEFHCGGYAKTTVELFTFMREFTQDTGVLLDPIYTGKMMLAIKKLVTTQEIKKGEKILAIHTGGLTGWFGKYAEI
jgi:1-aminocyclopropane-1-carboxylate deaminase